MLNSENGKDSKAKQMAGRNSQKNQKNQQLVKCREIKKKTQNMVNRPTSPIPTPTNMYFRSMTETNFSFHTKTITEFYQSYNEKGNIRNYSQYPNIKYLAIGLFIISFSGYIFLKKFLNLPHERTVQRWISNETQNTPIQFSLESSSEIIERYIKNYNVTQKIQVTLSVDAFSIKPNLIIDENGVKRGTLYDEKIDDSKVEEMHKSIIFFENFSMSNKKIMISDTFVYLVQPLIEEFPCFIIHLNPSSQGKATIKEIEILLYLKDVLARYNFSVKGFGFDGDTTYGKLVREWNSKVYNYYHSKKNIESIFNFDKKIAVDPLHLLKRWRYRIFKGKLQQFFEESDEFVDIFKWKHEFDIPSLVLLDKPFLKMNDELPLKLFDSQILYNLFLNNDKPTLSYFFVPSILITALNFKCISKNDREILLESCLYFLFLYQDTLKTVKKPLTDKPYKNKKVVRMIPNNILYDSVATISTILFLLKEDKNSTIYLNRIGSNPVEHCIGGIRMLSKNQNTFHKLKKIIGRKNLLSDIYREIKANQKITGRLPTLGQNLMNSSKTTLFNFEPHTLAISFFEYLGFSYNKTIISNLLGHEEYSSSVDFKEYVEFFFASLKKAMHIEQMNHSKKKYLSTSKFDSTETVKIQQRYYGTGQFFKKQ